MTSTSSTIYLSIDSSPRKRSKSFTSIVGLGIGIRNTLSSNSKDSALNTSKSSLGTNSVYDGRLNDWNDIGMSYSTGSRGEGMNGGGRIGEVPRTKSVQSNTSTKSTQSQSLKAPKRSSNYSTSATASKSMTSLSRTSSPDPAFSSSSDLSTSSGGRILRSVTGGGGRDQPNGLPVGVDENFLFPSQSSRGGNNRSKLLGRDTLNSFDREFGGVGNTVSSGGVIASLGRVPFLDESGHQIDLETTRRISASSTNYRFPSTSNLRHLSNNSQISPPSREEIQKRTEEMLDAILGPVPTSNNSGNKSNRKSGKSQLIQSTTSASVERGRIRSISSPLLPSSHKHFLNQPPLPIPPQIQHIRNITSEREKQYLKNPLVDQNSPPRPSTSSARVLCETYTFPKPRIRPYTSTISNPISNSPNFIVGGRKGDQSKGKGKELLQEVVRNSLDGSNSMEELSLRGVLRENEESRIERENWNRNFQTRRKLKKIDNRSSRDEENGNFSDSELFFGFGIGGRRRRRKDQSVDESAVNTRKRAGSEAGLISQSQLENGTQSGPLQESPPLARSFDPFSSLVHRVKSTKVGVRKSSISNPLTTFDNSIPTTSRFTRQRSNSHLGITTTTTSPFSESGFHYLENQKHIFHTKQSPSLDTLYHRPNLTTTGTNLVVGIGQAISTTSTSAVPSSIGSRINKGHTVNNSFSLTPPRLHHLLKPSLVAPQVERDRDETFIPSRKPPDIPTSIPSFSSRLNRFLLNPLPDSDSEEVRNVSPGKKLFVKEAALALMLCDKLDADAGDGVKEGVEHKDKDEGERPAVPGFTRKNSFLFSTTKSSRIKPLPFPIPLPISSSSNHSRSNFVLPSATTNKIGNHPYQINLPSSYTTTGRSLNSHLPLPRDTSGSSTSPPSRSDSFPEKLEFGTISNNGNLNEEIKTPKTGGSYNSYNSERSSVWKMDDSASFKDLFFKPPQAEFLLNSNPSHRNDSPSSNANSNSNNSNFASPLREAFFGEIIPRPIRFGIRSSPSGGSIEPKSYNLGVEGESETVSISNQEEEEEEERESEEKIFTRSDYTGRDVLVLEEGMHDEELESVDAIHSIEGDSTIFLIPGLNTSITSNSTRPASFIDFTNTKEDEEEDSQYLHFHSNQRNSQDSAHTTSESFLDFTRDEDTLPSFLDWSPARESPIIARGHSFLSLSGRDEEEKEDTGTISRNRDRDQSSSPSLLPPPSQTQTQNYLQTSTLEVKEIEKPSPSTISSARFTSTTTTTATEYSSPRISSWSSSQTQAGQLGYLDGLEGRFPRPPPIAWGYDSEIEIEMEGEDMG